MGLFCIEKLIKAALTEVKGKWQEMVLSFRVTDDTFFREKHRMNKWLPSYEDVSNAEK